MTYETIAQVEDLRAMLARGADVLVLDCEFDLGDPDRGRALYLEAHLPGARYLDLELDLSGEVTGSNGRHPLPARTAFAATMRGFGLKSGQQVIAYDGNGGIYAARLWWMLRWLGHGAVAVLDGGRQAWGDADLPSESGEPGPVREGDFMLGEPLVGQPITAREVLANIGTGELQVIDARDAQRFAGAPHPLDTVSGHIPGASNRFYRDNYDANGRLKKPAELAEAFGTALNGKTPEQAVLQCGSGVTACHNLLAMEVAGLKGGRLYPGSWSEWTSDPSRPVER
ncbi:thiosulfate/3-mercaptopyruvate sulfurtransferase [Novosphingobium chloroacetimidivorans]|uniref:Thiosulfate/3-mercaptopyruvate sulfurtransferase n=1 Tax=Novosphingobium chloroacetimidivorans TaxID=1428314 RepID=A0A7W7K7F6_9SPHN|nr:sulfurtransferase [Novosphingobium chloroacetimidivorans]MBB4857592.1 thiosulfate/3-mercaptopyruvate sulfurtransferase [Novosphingobium chloroacetimidivorans]